VAPALDFAALIRSTFAQIENGAKDFRCLNPSGGRGRSWVTTFTLRESQIGLTQLDQKFRLLNGLLLLRAIPKCA